MAKQARSLQGKVVVITGGARGIGAATTRALVAKGARVAIGDLDEDATKSAAKELGPDVLGLRLDVTDHAGFTAFLDEVERELGSIDVLINNAGIMPLALLEEESPETTARQLAINLAAVIHGTREAMRRMTPRGRGHIVNIASMAGRAGMAGAATYCATKHGVVGLSESVYWELQGSGVEVTVVTPTIVRTELSAGLKETRLSSQVAPEDVANAIAKALEFPTPEISVPEYLGPLTRFLRVLPWRVTRRIAVSTGTDRLLSDAAHSHERDAYEARAAASAPAADHEPADREAS